VQNYIIPFEATGSLTTLDSIRAENLDLGTSLTINGTDSLHLTGISVQEICERYRSDQTFPFPALID
jgi:hypothetical protein